MTEPNQDLRILCPKCNEEMNFSADGYVDNYKCCKNVRNLNSRSLLYGNHKGQGGALKKLKRIMTNDSECQLIIKEMNEEQWNYYNT